MEIVLPVGYGDACDCGMSGGRWRECDGCGGERCIGCRIGWGGFGGGLRLPRLERVLVRWRARLDIAVGLSAVTVVGPDCAVWFFFGFS